MAWYFAAGKGFALGALSLAPSTVSAHSQQTVFLSHYGAIGDGKTDDTAAFYRAFSAESNACLDGQGRIYRVRGTLRASNDLCLTNVTLQQDTAAFDTRPLITGKCPVVADPNGLIDCGDPIISRETLSQLTPYLFTRTLLIRPESGKPKIKVILRNVLVDRGGQPASGARSEAAGVWIQWADKVELDNVEITGGGKGFGLMIAHASNVVARNVHLHDLVWAPYAGERPLTLDEVRRIGWNTVPIHEFREAGQQGAKGSGFYGTRVQEQLSCLMIVSSQNVRFEGLRVKRCVARFDGVDMPWQADGIGIGESSSNIRIARKSEITDTWEGIDVVGGGTGVRDVHITDTSVTNSFAYGIKLGYDLSRVKVDKVRIRWAGLAGIVLYGAVRNALVRRTQIDRVGTVAYGKAETAPWVQERAGVLIEPRDDRIPDDYPKSVVLDRVSVVGGDNCRSGVTNITPLREKTRQVFESGCDYSRIDRPPAAPRQ